MKKSKQGHANAKLILISDYKMAVKNGLIPPGLTVAKIDKIIRQVDKRLAERKNVLSYQPFTSRAPKRKPRQVGAGTQAE